MLRLFELLKNCQINGLPIENLLEDCNFIKYAAYRTAAKLRLIQKVLHLDKVRIKVISNVFERYQLRQNENSISLNEKDVEAVLSDIFFVAQKENSFHWQEHFVLQLIMRFLLNIFSRDKQSKIQVLSLKIFLTVLCESKPREKYQYLFDQISDHSYHLNRKNLMILLLNITKITEFVCEGRSFGSKLICGTVESCFEGKPEYYLITEETFIAWLMQDPQLLVWLSTLYRMQISESVIHDAKCAICKIYPIIGLKYHCLRCLSYNICQICFFTGKINKNHKLKHPVQEYCFPVNSQQCAKAFFLTLKNKLYKKNSKLQYLPALESGLLKSKIGQYSKFLDEMEISSKTLIDGSRISFGKVHHEQVKDMIFHLEKDFEKLIILVENFFCNANKFDSNDWFVKNQNSLTKYKVEIKSRLQELKLYHNDLITSKSFSANTFFASTPLRKSEGKVSQSLESMSPIAECSIGNVGQVNDLIWDNYDLTGNCKWDTPQKYCQISESKKLSLIPKLEENEIKKEKNLSLSTFLGKNVLEFTSNPSEFSLKNSRWEQLRKFEGKNKIEENMEMLADVHSDLRKILWELHELSIATSGENDDGDNPRERNYAEKMGFKEADAILKDLMNGVKKLI